MNLFNWSCPMLMTMHSSFLTVRRVVGDESVLDGVHVHAHHGGIGELGAQLAAEAVPSCALNAPATPLWSTRQPARSTSPPRRASMLGRHPSGPVLYSTNLRPPAPCTICVQKQSLLYQQLQPAGWLIMVTDSP